VIRTGDGKLLTLSDEGFLQLAEDTGKEFHTICSAKVCGGSLTNPALSNGRLFLRDDKNIICYQVGE
jgi:hypothetical protein